MERLKLLDYNHLLLKEVKLKPISRYYFLKPNNSGEQFFMFVSICAFCFRKIGKDFKQPQEEDDPTPLLLNILKYLEELVKMIDETFYATSKISKNFIQPTNFSNTSFINSRISPSISHPIN